MEVRKEAACFWTHCARNIVKYLNPRYVLETDTLYVSCQVETALSLSLCVCVCVCVRTSLLLSLSLCFFN